MLVTFSGIDGSGKTTCAKSLGAGLSSQGISNKKFSLGGYALLFPFTILLGKLMTLAGKRKSMRSSDNPLLKRNYPWLMRKTWVLLVLLDTYAWYVILLINSLFVKVIICDRYFYDKLVGLKLHGFADHKDVKVITPLIPKADLPVFLDISPAKAQQRERGDTHSLDFYSSLKEGFNHLEEKIDFLHFSAESTEVDGIVSDIVNRVKERLNK
jgi:thymidylate kinase